MPAALNSLIKAPDFLFQVGGTPATVEGLLTGRLSWNRNLVETVAGAPTNYFNYCLGVVAAQAEMEGGWNETNPECSSGASLQWDGANDMLGVESFTITMEAREVEVTTLASSGTREVRPGRLKCGLSFRSMYYDVLGTNAQWSEAEANIRAGGSAVTATLNWGTGSSLALPCHMRSMQIERNDDDYLRVTGTADSNGDWVTPLTSAAATNIGLILASLTGGTSLAVRGTPVTAGMTRYDFTGYTVRFEIQVQVNQQIRFRSVVAADGAVTPTTII